MKKILLICLTFAACLVMHAAVSVLTPESGKVYTIFHYDTKYALTFCWEDSINAQPDSVKLLPYSYLPEQQFYIVPVGDSIYTIQNVSNGYYLSRSDGTNALLPSGTAAWDMMWQAAMPEDQTLVQFKIEGYISEQFAQLKSISRFNESATKCYIGIDYGADGTGNGGILYDDKLTSYGIKSQWMIKEVTDELDTEALEALMTEAGLEIDAFGEGAPGSDDLLLLLDEIDAALLEAEKQEVIDNYVEELTDAIAVFRITNASEEHPVDVTEYYFGGLSENWLTNVSPATNFSLTSNITAGEYTGEYFEHWTDSPQSGKYLYRTATVPIGNYSLKAACSISGGISTFFYANETQIACSTEDATGAYFDLGRFFVNNGTLEFGLRGDDASSQWYAISEIELIYYGYSNSGMAAAIQELITKAEACKDGYMQSSLTTVLDEAIAAGEAAILDGSDDVLTAASDQLTTAIASAEASAAAYTALLAKINEADELYDATAVGAEDFENAILDATDDYDEQTLSAEEVEAVIVALTGAMRTFELAGASADSPLDISSYLENYNMDAGNTGWNWITSDAKKTNTKTSSYTGFAGAYFLEEWVASSTTAQKTLGDFDIYQTLTGMPNGTYTFSVYCIATNQGYDVPSEITGVELYVNDKAVAVATDNGVSQLVSIVYYNTSDSLRVGFRGISHTCNWWAWDEANLVFSGKDNSTIDAEKATLMTLIESVSTAIEPAKVIKGDGPFQIASAAFDAIDAAIEAAMNAYDAATTAEDVQVAKDALNAALATFKATPISAPDLTKKYVFHHNLSGLVMDATGDQVEVYANEDYILGINEYVEGNPEQEFMFVAAPDSAARPYFIKSMSGKYITLKGTNRWTMDLRPDGISEAAIDSATFSIGWAAENFYYIYTNSACLGTNDGVIDIYSPLYADKSTSLTSTYWVIEEIGLNGIQSIGKDAKTQISIEGDVLRVSGEKQTVNIYNITGQRMTIASSSEKIGIANLPKGVYVVKTSDGTAVKFFKR